MDLELNGRVAVVTGASKGIGLAVTRTLLAEGARVVAASRTRTDALDALDGALLHVPVDLMQPEAPAEVIARAVETFGRVDILVNNVGGPPPGVVLPRSSFLDASDADWLAVFELNVHSAVRTARAAIPLLVEGGGGSIVNVTTGLVSQPSPVNVEYGAAKAALANMTKALSEEFGPMGVRVNSVAPGPVLTPWWTDEGGVADMLAKQAGTDRATVLETVVPEAMSLVTGRLVSAQEVADVIALLCSPRSASTTGAEIRVDGGFVKAV